jgi:predicted TIM-barrel fold metal-dependent hydrolase
MGQDMPERMPLDLFWWGSDFPHSVGTFPRSQDYIKETLSALDDDLLHTVLVGNAAKHLHLDLDADITETPTAA